ncbi:MAG: tetratricopeptide repeat protein [Chromatiales bacterium]|nr:tetratricopeptide repeat protein [Chromatiales bacterium]
MKKIAISTIRRVLVAGCLAFLAAFNSYATTLNQELNTLIKQGKYDEALADIEKRQAEGDEHPSLELLKGAVLVRRGDLDKAMMIFDRLVKLHPNDAAIFNNIGVIHAEKGDMVNARQAFEKALEISPNYEQALYNLGDVYAELACRTYGKIDKPQTGIVPAFCHPETDKAQPIAAKPVEMGAEQKQVFAAVEQWQANWSAQNVSGYLASYSESFKPAKMSRETWVKKREKALQRPEWIKVVLADPQVSVADNQAEVKFIQRYTASNYQDVVMKQLTLSQEADGWKIVKEVVK